MTPILPVFVLALSRIPFITFSLIRDFFSLCIYFLFYQIPIFSNVAITILKFWMDHLQVLILIVSTMQGRAGLPCY